jgi:hypothetical protein
MLHWQRATNFETFGELTVEDGVLARQNPGQPMAHELQDEFRAGAGTEIVVVPRRAAGRGFARPGGMFGKHGLGASRQLSGISVRK